MSVTAIVILIIIGLLLVVTEVLIVPGIHVAAIAGFVLTLTGIILAYYFHGTTVGHWILGVSLLVGIFLAFIMLKEGTWDRVSLKTTLDGKVNVIEEEKVKPGDMGIAVSRLAPMGRIMVNDELFEGKSLSGYITENTEIEVVKIENYYIIVKPKTH